MKPKKRPKRLNLWELSQIVDLPVVPHIILQTNLSFVIVPTLEYRQAQLL